MPWKPLATPSLRQSAGGANASIAGSASSSASPAALAVWSRGWSLPATTRSSPARATPAPTGAEQKGPRLSTRAFPHGASCALLHRRCGALSLAGMHALPVALRRADLVHVRILDAAELAVVVEVGLVEAFAAALFHARLEIGTVDVAVLVEI